ncbi:hypothetical protein lbkm_0241 [Lachnospiraceae bacterium KM106-2]|nr:hypothetical protein lbkm_0241 [Lachnospiraceae bacterium KM106-2]
MAKATDTYGILKQNLEDAGCEKEIIDKCMVLASEDCWNEIPKLVAAHKSKLLDIMHTSQNQIDCLDFLVYKIGKEHK